MTTIRGGSLWRPQMPLPPIIYINIILGNLRQGTCCAAVVLRFSTPLYVYGMVSVWCLKFDPSGTLLFNSHPPRSLWHPPF